MSGGWTPTVHLTSHLGGKPTWSEALAAFVPGTLPPGMSVVGAANGVMTLAAGLAAAAMPVQRAASETGHTASSSPLPKADDEPADTAALWHVSGGRGLAFVDFQNDVTTKDIGLASREGYRSVELLKRYTTLGMATDQGKTSNVNGLALLAAQQGRPIDAVGTTLNRPPLHAGRDRRARRSSSRQGVPRDAAVAVARLGRQARRGVRRGRRVAARVVVPARRRGLAGRAQRAK